MLFVVIINDDEFFAEKYPKTVKSASDGLVEQLSRKLSGRHLKAMLLKSYNIFVASLQMVYDKSVESEKRRFLSSFLAAHDDTPLASAATNLNDDDPTKSLDSFLRSICQLHILEEQRQASLKYHNQRLDGFHA